MRICSYILLVFLTLQSFYSSILTIDYQVNLVEYLAKCVNKGSPELHCNGQCILMQEIKNKEEQEGAKNRLVYEYSSLYIHSVNSAFPISKYEDDLNHSFFASSEADYRFDYNTLVFRPPIA